MKNHFPALPLANSIAVCLLMTLCFLPNAGCRRPVITYQGEGMMPAIPPGSRLVVDFKAFRRTGPDRFDIVLFQPPPLAMMDGGSLLAFRVIGKPGESIAIRHDQVFVNGEELPLPAGVSYRPVPPQAMAFSSAKLGGNEYFVLGDNSASAFDSRAFGAVERDLLVGRVKRIHPPKGKR